MMIPYQCVNTNPLRQDWDASTASRLPWQGWCSVRSFTLAKQLAEVVPRAQPGHGRMSEPW